MPRKVAGVYTITCSVNRRVYVGSTRSLAQRKSTHFWSLRNGRHHCKPLQEDFTRHGESSFIFEPFEFPFCDIRREEKEGIEYYRVLGLCYNTGNVVNTRPLMFGPPSAPHPTKPLEHRRQRSRHSTVKLRIQPRKPSKRKKRQQKLAGRALKRFTAEATWRRAMGRTRHLLP